MAAETSTTPAPGTPATPRTEGPSRPSAPGAIRPDAPTGIRTATTPAGAAALDAPPPAASARFPDAPPTAGRPVAGFRRGDAPAERRPAASDGATPAASARFPDAPPTVGRPVAGFRRGDSPAEPRPVASDGATPAASARFPDTPPTAGRPAAGFPRGDAPAERRPAAPSGAPPAERRPAAPSGASPAAADAAPATTPSRPGTTGSAWSPFSRARMPEAAPRHDDAVPGRVAAVTGAPPAWTPAAPVRHPDFAPSGARTAADPYPPGPDPALSWSAPPAPGGSTRPHVTFARPEGVGEAGRGDGGRGRVVAAAVSMVLGLGLVVGAATGSWLAGDAAGAGERSAYTAAAGLWRSVPVDQLFPPTVTGRGAGPGGADRTWTRIAVAPDGGCADAFDPLLRQVLAPVGCSRLLRATYTDATQSYVTTVGLLFTTADPAAMRALDTRFDKEGLARRTDLLPRPYAAPGTAAAGFGDRQRASWTVSVLTDAPVVVYAVSGWADGRTVAVPQPAAEAAATGATTAPAQAGLGNEAKGLADRVERGLRTTAASPSARPS
ncbi:hypothetical protein ACF081_13730 [Streptomyces longwoodensis]|uniref:hypothetical protein n=1 Tax=Streptomyces longwoodensis TaxID=68231 RepID=UPI0036FF4673